MSVMVPVPKDDPLMIAWESYKTTPAYANAKKWAAHEEHYDGSLWAAFVQGWNAFGHALAAKKPLVELASSLEEMPDAD